jgi:hypothetical protein
MVDEIWGQISLIHLLRRMVIEEGSAVESEKCADHSGNFSLGSTFCTSKAGIRLINSTEEVVPNLYLLYL